MQAADRKIIMSWLQRSYILTTIKRPWLTGNRNTSGIRSCTYYFAICYSETNTNYSFRQGIFHNL